MIAELRDLTIDRRSGRQILSLSLAEDFGESFDALNGSPVEVKITKARKRRSKDANAMLWEIVGLIAENQRVTPNEVYRHEIMQAGVYTALSMTKIAYSAFLAAWSERGIGWFCVVTDDDGETVTVLAYHGSSSYDSAQMARLIDNTVADAKALGIDVSTEAEKELLRG